jgi:hypothetical protein
MLDNSDSELQSAEQTAPTVYQQVRKLSLEHADVTSSAVIDTSIPLTVSALIRRLLEEAIVLPPSMQHNIIRFSKTAAVLGSAHSAVNWQEVEHSSRRSCELVSKI